MNHDALFKSLLKTGRLLRDFFEAFLPEIHAFIDFNHIEFVDKERFTLDGKRRTGDLLIKTRCRRIDPLSVTSLHFTNKLVQNHAAILAWALTKSCSRWCRRASGA
jgi:hypothetical protein